MRIHLVISPNRKNIQKWKLISSVNGTAFGKARHVSHGVFPFPAVSCHSFIFTLQAYGLMTTVPRLNDVSFYRSYVLKPCTLYECLKDFRRSS
jgi:hypothetical protein